MKVFSDNPSASVKDRLSASLGRFGVAMFYIVCYGLTFVPLVYCGFPWWCNLLIYAVILSTNFLGGAVTLGVWVYSLVLVLRLGRIGPFEIVYFVFLAIYAIIFFIPGILTLISSIFMKK